jgi:hypothetical protein
VHPVVSSFRVSRPLVFCVVICRPLLVPLSFFMLPLYRLSFFNLRLLITSLFFSNFLVRFVLLDRLFFFPMKLRHFDVSQIYVIMLIFVYEKHLSIQRVIRCRQSKKDREYNRKRRAKYNTTQITKN